MVLFQGKGHEAPDPGMANLVKDAASRCFIDFDTGELQLVSLADVIGVNG